MNSGGLAVRDPRHAASRRKSRPDAERAGYPAAVNPAAVNPGQAPPGDGLIDAVQMSVLPLVMPARQQSGCLTGHLVLFHSAGDDHYSEF